MLEEQQSGSRSVCLCFRSNQLGSQLLVTTGIGGTDRQEQLWMTQESERNSPANINRQTAAVIRLAMLPGC
jgi:hypothetical protein